MFDSSVYVTIMQFAKNKQMDDNPLRCSIYIYFNPHLLHSPLSSRPVLRLSCTSFPFPDCGPRLLASPRSCYELTAIKQKSYQVLCCVMLCYVVLCRVMLCCVVLCCVMLLVKCISYVLYNLYKRPVVLCKILI